MAKALGVLLFSVGVLFTSSIVVFAQEAEGAPAVTSYDFEDDLVTGDLVRPDGEMLSVRSANNRSSLIKIRENFVPEMLKSVEDL